MNTANSGLKGQPIAALPFVRTKRGAAPDFWHVQPSDDYAAACEKGREYAATLAQYLRDNPGCARLFARIVASIDFADQSPTKGYRAGFLHHWEHITLARPEHLFADLYIENRLHTVAGAA